jgi:hypothetical protein
MRCQSTDAQIHMEVFIFKPVILDQFGTWHLEDVELDIFMVALVLELLVHQIIVEGGMGQRIGGIMVVWDEVNRSLLLKIQVQKRVLEVVSEHLHVVVGRRMEFPIRGLDLEGCNTTLTLDSPQVVVWADGIWV